MTKSASIALCQAIALSDDGAVPEWLHLLPTGTIRTADGRGPYTASDLPALMAASLQSGGKLVLDENHATDLAAPKGLPAPARGWIVELQARGDGVWGRVEWSPEGRELMASKAYRGVSPVIAYRQRDKAVTAILRASLVNKPNLEGLTALHSEEQDMDLKAKIAEALGLGADADEEAILSALKKAVSGDTVATATQAALAPIADALGLAADADLVAGIAALKAGAASDADSDVVVALQAELADVAGQLKTMQEATARHAAETFVDGAIAEGRVGVKPLRDEYIAMHIENPERARKLIGGMPAVAGAGIGVGGRTAPKASGDLDVSDRRAMALMGISAEDFKKARLAELGEEEEAL